LLTELLVFGVKVVVPRCRRVGLVKVSPRFAGVIALAAGRR
jgi:hypothetical protein